MSLELNLKPVPLIFWILLAMHFIAGQKIQAQPSRKTDSLYALVRAGGTDTVYTKLLNKLGDAYLDADQPDSSIKYLQKAIKIGQTFHYKKSLSRSYNLIGIAYRQQHDYPQAMKYFEIALRLCEELDFKKGIARNLGNIGIVYHYQGNYPMAMEYYLRSLKLGEEMKEVYWEGYVNSSLGDLNYDMNEMSKAMKYYQISMQLFKTIDDKYEVANKKQRIGNVLMEQKKPLEALSYFLSSLKTAKELDNNTLVAIALANTGNVYQTQGNYSKALQYYLEAMPISEASGSDNSISAGFLNLGSIYLLQKKYKQAEDFIQKGLALAKKIGDPLLIRDSYDCMWQLYEATKDYEKALDNKREYFSLKDSLFTVEKNKDITRKEMRYEFEKREAIEKAKNEEELALADAEKKRQVLFFWFIVAVAASIGVITLIILRSLRVTKKQKVKIEEQKQLLEEHQKDIIDSITYAKRIQEAILPPLSLIRQKLPESFVLYKPKDIVAGDFYWMEEFDETIFIAAADCTGHGVPGALVSVVCSNALTRAVKEFGLRETGKILDKTKELVLDTFVKSSEEVKDGMDISLLSINKKTKKIYWSGANNPLWYIHQEVLKEIKADKQPIGKSDFEKPFTSHAIEYSEDLRFYLFTDGLADQFGGTKGKKFKYKQFSELLLNSKHQKEEELQKTIENVFSEWKGSLEQVDDVCVIGIKI